MRFIIRYVPVPLLISIQRIHVLTGSFHFLVIVFSLEIYIKYVCAVIIKWGLGNLKSGSNGLGIHQNFNTQYIIIVEPSKSDTRSD